MRMFTRCLIAMAALVALLFTGGPAQAAGPYTIVTGAGNPTAFALSFQLSGCNQTLLNSPANGTDSRVIDVSALAGATRTVRYTSVWTGTVAEPVGGVNFIFGAFNSSCARTQLAAARAGTQAWSIAIPAGTKWLAVSGDKSVNISFTIS